MALGQMQQALEHVEVATDLAERSGDRRRLAQALCFRSNCLFSLGDPDAAITTAQKAQEISFALGDARLLTMSTYYRGQGHAGRSEHRDAVHWFQESLDSLAAGAIAESGSLAGLPIVYRTNMAWSLGALGEFARGLACAEEAVRIAHQSGRSTGLIIAALGIGGLHYWSGGFTKAIAALEPALALCETDEFGLLRMIGAAQLGWAYLLAGRVSEAIRLSRRSADEAMRVGYWCWPLWTCNLAEASLAAGDLTVARQSAEVALRGARSTKMAEAHPLALRTLGDVLARLSQFDAAQAHYDQALAIAGNLSLRPLEARCHLGLGKLYHKTGKGEQAREHLATATTMCREMGITYWLEQTETVLKGLED